MLSSFERLGFPHVICALDSLHITQLVEEPLNVHTINLGTC